MAESGHGSSRACRVEDGVNYHSGRAAHGFHLGGIKKSKYNFLKKIGHPIYIYVTSYQKYRMS